MEETSGGNVEETSGGNGPALPLSPDSASAEPATPRARRTSRRLGFQSLKSPERTTISPFAQPPSTIRTAAFETQSSRTRDKTQVGGPATGEVCEFLHRPPSGGMRGAWMSRRASVGGLHRPLCHHEHIAFADSRRSWVFPQPVRRGKGLELLDDAQLP